MISKPRKLKELFEKAVQSNTDIKGLILSSEEGLVMISTFEVGIKEDTISAMVSSINSSIKHYFKSLDWDTFSNIIITCEKEYIVIKSIEGIGLLAILTNSDINWQKLNSNADYLISIISSLE